MQIFRLLLLALLTLGTPARGAERMNVLFILTEDQGVHLGCLGTADLQTPHMDALARAGTLFTNAFVVYPVCSASKAAIYTGLINHANGILNNTLNLHMPAAKVPAQQRQHPLFRRNRIKAHIPTLVELLHQQGYYQGVTHKLHVLPNEKFPYDEFLKGDSPTLVAEFIDRAKATSKPWFLLYNTPRPHRPFRHSDDTPLTVDPEAVDPPPFLPPTDTVRLDWAEYLSAIEQADERAGGALRALRESGEEGRTLVIFMGDHGPAFQHGKMTLHDLGLRVPLIFKGPGIRRDIRPDALATELDLLPTILEFLNIAPPATLHGKSLKPLLTGQRGATGSKLVFAEISDRGPLPNDGMQERCVFDGRYKLIYRERTDTNWRQVNADSSDWKLWRNRTYAETVRVKDQFPEQYRILSEMCPQMLGGKTPPLEFYDLQNDPFEMNNLAGDEAYRDHVARLFTTLEEWADETGDDAVTFDTHR